MPNIPDNPQPAESSKPLLEQTPVERRLRLLPQALNNQTLISDGQMKYQQFLQATETLTKNPSDKTAQDIIYKFNFYLRPNGQPEIRSFEKKIGRLETIKARGYDENTVSQIETATTESIAIGYGIFTEAIKAGDITTCVSVLSCLPDLSYHHEICQLLETAVAQKLSNPKFLKEIVGQIATKPNEFGSLDTVSYLYQSYNGDLHSDEAIAHLDPIFLLTTIARGTNIQNEIESDKQKALGGKSLGKRLQEYEDRLNTLWGFQDGRENLNKMVGILGQQIDLDFDHKLPSDLPGLLSQEHYAYSITQLTKADFFNNLPANIQQEIKLHLLGNIIGLAQHAVDAADSSQVNPAFIDNRINIITQLLEPIITADNFPTENPGDLQNLEATAIWQIFTTLDQKPQLSQQLKQKLEEIVSRKSNSTPPVENQPEPQPEPAPESVEPSPQSAESVTPPKPEPEVAQPTVEIETTAPTEKPHQSEATAEQLHLVAKFIAELPTYKATIRGTKPEDIVNRIHQFRQTKLSNLPDTDPLIIMLEMTQAEIRKKY